MQHHVGFLYKAAWFSLVVYLPFAYAFMHSFIHFNGDDDDDDEEDCDGWHSQPVVLLVEYDFCFVESSFYFIYMTSIYRFNDLLQQL